MKSADNESLAIIFVWSNIYYSCLVDVNVNRNSHRFYKYEKVSTPKNVSYQICAWQDSLGFKLFLGVLASFFFHASLRLRV